MKHINGQIKGNLAMLVSKIFSGFNENALKYLLPTWMSAFSGVFLRVVFASAFFWIIGIFSDREKPGPTTVQKLQLLLLGLICVFGYMFFLLMGLTYTTPISSSIFISLQPVCVFIICLCLGSEKATTVKVLGIATGVIGALICVMTQKSSDVASDPALGNLFCAGSMVTYSVYLIISKRFLAKLDSVTVSKWSFLGAAISATAVVAITGWDAPVLREGLFSTPMLVLLFVLIFPSSISYLLIDVGLKNLSATVVSLYGAVILIVASIVSYCLGQDRFSWWQILSIALIILSVYLVEGAERRSAPVAPPH